MFLARLYCLFRPVMVKYSAKGATYMMYPFMTLNDDTEITHSEEKPWDKGTVRDC